MVSNHSEKENYYSKLRYVIRAKLFWVSEDGRQKEGEEELADRWQT